MTEYPISPLALNRNTERVRDLQSNDSLRFEPVTQLLRQSRQGNDHAFQQLMSLVYDQLRKLAARCLRSERSNHTLQATALVHEAYLRLAQADVDWRDRVHFFAVSARIMRHILVDHAKAAYCQKRGGAAETISADDMVTVAKGQVEDILAVNEALERLAIQDRRKRDILEIVLFGGLTYEEAGEALGLSAATIHRELKLAKAWLHRELKPNGVQAPFA